MYGHLQEKRTRLQIGDVYINQIQNFKYVGKVLTEVAKCDTKIRKCIGLTKDERQ